MKMLRNLISFSSSLTLKTKLPRTLLVAVRASLVIDLLVNMYVRMEDYIAFRCDYF